MRDGLRMMLEAEAGFSVVGEASDLDETHALLLDRTPGVLVLDLHMGRELSLGVLSTLRAASPGSAIVILTMDDDPAFAQQAWAAGAAGYVLKEASRADLVRAIRMVSRGGRYLDPAVGGWALEGGGTAVLSEREIEVLRLVALGHTNTEIAKQMYSHAAGQRWRPNPGARRYPAAVGRHRGGRSWHQRRHRGARRRSGPGGRRRTEQIEFPIGSCREDQ